MEECVLFKKILILISVFVILLSLSVASAADNATDDAAGDITLDDSLKSSPQTFEKLNATVNGNDSAQIDLYENYTYSAGDERFREGVEISRNVCIDGHGITISGDGSARIFKVTSGNVIIKNINFIRGSSEFGGAVYGGSAINCTFRENHASNLGGGMFGDAINCTFEKNSADMDGGGMFGNATECIFINNHANDCGGGMIGMALMSTFTDNYADKSAGAMYGIAINSTFSGNWERMADPYSVSNAVLCHIENDYSRSINIITNLIRVSNFTSSYGSGEKLNFTVKYEEYILNGYKTTISIYQGDAFIANYSALSGEDWTVDLRPGTYRAVLSLDGYAEVEKAEAILIINEALKKPVAQTGSVKTVVKLALKKLKVKKSAKKLVLTATLKINKKAVKGKIIKFKFNKKTLKAKTNKNGVAKVTVKKSLLKKLKVGKKVTYSATYAKNTVKKTVKVLK